ncbi:MAG: hypothetical protein ACLURV_04595 [Gallintestinimicrobium sp.]
MFGQWKKLLSCLFKTSGSQGITSEELFTIVEEAQEEGSIDKEEGSLLRSALSFDDLEAGDILTPRIDMEESCGKYPGGSCRSICKYRLFQTSGL